MTLKRISIVVVGILAAIVIAMLLRHRPPNGGPDGPTVSPSPKPPGDIIIVRPTKPSGNSTYWAVGGTDAVSTVESGYALNKNAFGYVGTFETQLIDAAGKPFIVRPNKLEASFYTHCSVTTATLCDGDAACPSGETCLKTGVRVEKVTSGGSYTFKWTLIEPDSSEHELLPKDYGDSRKWRSDLCGKLASPATVSWISGADTKRADVTDADGCKIETRATP